MLSGDVFFVPALSVAEINVFHSVLEFVNWKMIEELGFFWSISKFFVATSYFVEFVVVVLVKITECLPLCDVIFTGVKLTPRKSIFRIDKCTSHLGMCNGENDPDDGSFLGN